MTTETSLEFVERMEKRFELDVSGEYQIELSRNETEQFLKLAKTAALIDEHRLGINPWSAYWDVQHRSGHYTEADDLHTAVRAVADKIKEGA